MTTYGWVDRKERVVRIPIEHAVDLLAARGIAGWPSPSPPRCTLSDADLDSALVTRRNRSCRGRRCSVIGLLVSSALVLLLLFALLFRFAIHYRAGNTVRPRSPHTRRAGIGRCHGQSQHWSPSSVCSSVGAQLFLNLQEAPKDALPVYVVAKQWMWKVQHRRPARDQRAARAARSRGAADHDVAGRDPRLLRAGVSHQAGRACPGRYTSMWFQADEAGRVSSVLRGILRHRPCADGRRASS